MKDSIYFSHDADARNDERIIDLMMSHGYEGYGIFWGIIEMLRTATEHKMHLQCKRIAFALHADESIVSSVIGDFGLFENDGEFFWSESLNRRMEKRNYLSNTRKKAAQKRWDSASAMQKQCKSNASAMQNDANKQTNKQTKETKETKKESASDDAMRVAEYLLTQIRTHKPDFKKPNMSKWAKDIDLAIRIDKRTPRELCEVAKWAHTSSDTFWRPNLLSGKKLREKFDQISIKMKNDNGGPTSEVIDGKTYIGGMEVV